MKLKVLLGLLLFLSTLSYAGERDRISFSFTPSLRGGVVGVKEWSVSPLAYNGPLAGIGLSFSAQSAKVGFFVDASASHGWLGNRYRRHPALVFHEQVDLSVGGMTGIYDNGRLSVKAGGALGFMESSCFNQLLDHDKRVCASRYSLAYDAKTCFSAEMRLSRRWSVLIEERIPVVAVISPSIRVVKYMPAVYSNHVWKAFPGNDLKAGLSRTFDGGNCLMLTIRHACYSSGNSSLRGFQLQMLELGFAFRFGLNKRGYHEYE